MERNDKWIFGYFRLASRNEAVTFSLYAEVDIGSEFLHLISADPGMLKSFVAIMDLFRHNSVERRKFQVEKIIL